MKNNKNKKGFTLIELLAVIVVLAIIMVLAVSTILPLMNAARRNAFATEATSAITGASDLMTVLPFNAIQKPTVGDDFRETIGTGGKSRYCITLKALGELGMYSQKDPAKVTGANPEYKGKVIIDVDASKANYTYKIVMGSSEFAIVKLGSSVSGTEVLVRDTTKHPDTALKCTTTDVNTSTTLNNNWA